MKAMTRSVPQTQLLRFLSRLVESDRARLLALAGIDLIGVQPSAVRERQASKR